MGNIDENFYVFHAFNFSANSFSIALYSFIISLLSIVLFEVDSSWFLWESFAGDPDVLMPSRQ